MEDTMLWLIGALALVLVVAALVWVLRRRDDTADAVPHHDYGAPEVRLTGHTDGGGLTFGSGGGDTVDQTVPRSRLGGAGWRDGDGDAGPTTTAEYAGESRAFGEEESAIAPEPTIEHHVEVDDTGPRPGLDDATDRERGGHW